MERTIASRRSLDYLVYMSDTKGCFAAESVAGTPVASPQDDDVDVSLVRWMLSLSPTERLEVLQGFVNSVAELRSGRSR